VGVLGGLPKQGVPVKLEVVDDRERKNFARAVVYAQSPVEIPDQGQPNLYLDRSAEQIVRDGFERALRSRGYSVDQTSETLLHVRLKKFLFEQKLHGIFGESTFTTEVLLVVGVESHGQVLVNKTIGKPSKEEMGAGFLGLYVKGVTGDQISNSFSKQLTIAIDESLDSDDLVAAIMKSHSLAMDRSPSPARVTEQQQRPQTDSLIWRPEGRRKVWVVAIGISRFKDHRLPVLPFARNDATSVQNWFAGLESIDTPVENTRVLLDEQATHKNFLVQIDWLRKHALPEDAVFVYFSTHGAAEIDTDGSSVTAKYLLLYDSDSDQLFATALTLDGLKRSLDTIQAKVQVVILETCYSRQIGGSAETTTTADLQIRERLIREIGTRVGRVVLSAVSGRETASVGESTSGGLFTNSLLSSWADGKRQLLSVCFEEASDQVRRAARVLGLQQNPTKYGDENIDILLSHY